MNPDGLLNITVQIPPLTVDEAATLVLILEEIGQQIAVHYAPAIDDYLVAPPPPDVDADLPF